MTEHSSTAEHHYPREQEISKAAYQLRWSLALFSTTDLPPSPTWADSLGEAIGKDGIRLLEQQQQSRLLLFFLSSKPLVTPPDIVKSVKGRLQHLLKSSVPKAFRRNFSITSVGEARREVVESYVASQLSHHRMADQRVEARFKDFQFVFPDVDPAAEQFSWHGVMCMASSGAGARVAVAGDSGRTT